MFQVRIGHLIAAAFIAVAAVPSNAAAQSPGAANEPSTPLYERLGGLKGITAVVDDFIDRLVTNKTLNRNPRSTRAASGRPRRISSTRCPRWCAR